MFVADSDGLNRFKSGFFVDNFTGFNAQENKVQIKNSIDRAHKELRPRHYTLIQLILFLVQSLTQIQPQILTLPLLRVIM